MVGDEGSSPPIASCKRKRASIVFTSDSENEDASTCELKTETQTNSDTEFQSYDFLVKATGSGSNLYKTATKKRRRLVNLGNAGSTPKRKVASHSVNSNSESEDDDHIPIGKLTLKSNSVPATVSKNSGSEDDDHVPIGKCMSKSSSVPATVSKNSGSEENNDVPIDKFMQNSSSVPAAVSINRTMRAVSRRRLWSSRKYERNGLHISSDNCDNLDARETNCYHGTSSEDDGEDACVEDNELESEGESSIVGSDNSDSDDASSRKSDSINSLSGNSDNGKPSGDSEYTSIMSNWGRHRERKIKWEFEAEMLADFGKDPELCMKAVCAVYWQQTSDEKSSKGTTYSNKRGFSHHDALRGASLAEFLTNGDPAGDLQKSVDELKKYDAEGIELCTHLTF